MDIGLAPLPLGAGATARPRRGGGRLFRRQPSHVNFSQPKPEHCLSPHVDACLQPAPGTVERLRSRALARGQKRLAMPGLAQLVHGPIQKRGSVTASLSSVNDEQRPDVTCLRIDAGEALQACVILRDEEDRMPQVPLDLLVGDQRRIGQRIFRRPAPDRVDAGKVRSCRGPQARGQGGFSADGSPSSHGLSAARKTGLLLWRSPSRLDTAVEFRHGKVEE
jgi:hypothetical protein